VYETTNIDLLPLASHQLVLGDLHKGFFYAKKMNFSQLIDVISKKTYHKVDDFNIRWSECKGRFYVYFLMYEDKIIYIGHTRNLYQRIVCHKQCFEFDRFALIEYNTYDESLSEERSWIKYHQPIFNIKSKN
jgi:hypothetical protein